MNEALPVSERSPKRLVAFQGLLIAACVWLSAGCTTDAAESVTNWPGLTELLGKWEPVPMAEIRRQAEAGNSSAQHYLGYCLAEGFRLERNTTEAVSWYQRALDGGYLPSASNLGFIYQRGLLGTNDWAKAVQYYRYAAQRGLPQAQMNLGVMYREGLGVAADQKEALHWFRLAAAQGHVDAMVEVGRAHRFGHAVGVELNEAIRWFEKAANEKNSSLAWLNLGLLYEENREADKSVSCYEQSASRGSTEAMIQLYHFFCEGKGGAKDRAKAVQWLKKAADSGSARAEYLMGEHCERREWVGEGRNQRLTRPDLVGALHWYRRAAEHGWPGGKYRLGLMYLEGKAVAVDEARALELIRAAADQGLKEAVQQLAKLYASGIGEPRSESERPVALLERAEVWSELVTRYEHGLGTEPDLVKAARCYGKLVIHGGWRYSRRSLSKMIEFQPSPGPAGARGMFSPIDRHLTIIGPPHHANADASDDVLRVLSIYLKAARGEGEAAFAIGEFYEKGERVPRLGWNAWAWFAVAAEKGSASAVEKKRVLGEQMSAVELELATSCLANIAADLREIAEELR